MCQRFLACFIHSRDSLKILAYPTHSQIPTARTHAHTQIHATFSTVKIIGQNYSQSYPDCVVSSKMWLPNWIQNSIPSAICFKKEKKEWYPEMKFGYPTGWKTEIRHDMDQCKIKIEMQCAAKQTKTIKQVDLLRSGRVRFKSGHSNFEF